MDSDIPLRIHDRRRAGWVSKSDIVRFERCEYAWWAFENGLMVRSPLALALLDRGNRVDRQVAAEADSTARQVSALAGNGPVTVGSGELTDAPRRIYGVPDGIVAMPDGTIAALEVKSHGRPRHTDDLELAFYSVLLSGHHGTRIAECGFLVTVGLDGFPRFHRRDLTRAHFDRVDELIEAVRDGRRNPPSDRYCGCPTCRARLSDRRERKRLERAELTMLWQLGPAAARGLAQVGINTITQLATVEPTTLQKQLADIGVHRHLDDIRGWEAHAAAYRTQAAVVFGDLTIPEPPYYLLDTEYDPTCPVFLIALGTVLPSGDLETPETWWAPTPELESKALTNLKAATETNPEWPIITWNGHSADLPMLRKAESRLGIADITEPMTARHIDLYVAVKAAIRLPAPGLSLKEVESFAGVEREGSIADGQMALSTYRRLKRQPNPETVAALRLYAAEDIVGLAEVLTYLREISRSDALAGMW